MGVHGRWHASCSARSSADVVATHGPVTDCTCQNGDTHFSLLTCFVASTDPVQVAGANDWLQQWVSPPGVPDRGSRDIQHAAFDTETGQLVQQALAS